MSSEMAVPSKSEPSATGSIPMHIDDVADMPHRPRIVQVGADRLDAFDMEDRGEAHRQFPKTFWA